MTAEAVRQAQHGDRRAFEELLAGRIDRLYATACLVLHDRTLAEDAVQEAMIRAWRSLPGLRDAGRFDAWLRQVLVHACMDAARRSRHHRREHELPMGLVDEADIATQVADRDAVVRAFERLSDDHRAAFVLRHYLGHTVPDVAATLRVPLGTAKSRLHYAEQAMAKAMDEADGGLEPEGGVA